MYKQKDIESNVKNSLFVQKICRGYLNKNQVSTCKLKKLEPLPTRKQNSILKNSHKTFQIGDGNKNDSIQSKLNTDWSKHLMWFSNQQQLKLGKLKQNENLRQIMKNRPQILIPLKQKPIFKYMHNKRVSLLTQKLLQKSKQTQHSLQIIYPYLQLNKDNSIKSFHHRENNYLKIMKKHLKPQQNKYESPTNKIDELCIKSLFCPIAKQKKQIHKYKQQIIQAWSKCEQINDKILD